MRSGAARLQKMFNAKQQGRLDGFFKVLPKKDDDKKKPAPAKRKVRLPSLPARWPPSRCELPG